MGLELAKVLPNGVPVAYHRINTVQIDVNKGIMLEVFSYPEGAREAEQEASDEEPIDVYKYIQWYQLDYDPDMSVNKAYELLKETDDYQEAEDVWDNWMVGESYYIGDIRKYEDVLYKCRQSHTSQAGWEPPNVPALWEIYEEESGIPVWHQPDSTNPYMQGDIVMHNDVKWISDVDNNVWEPGVYGWTRVLGEEE